jgi:hypothetical protein
MMPVARAHAGDWLTPAFNTTASHPKPTRCSCPSGARTNTGPLHLVAPLCKASESAGQARQHNADIVLALARYAPGAPGFPNVEEHAECPSLQLELAVPQLGEERRW